MPKKVKKIIHICIIISIIIAIGFVALMFVLDYSENGEKNMPFEISKITIVSTIDAQDVEDKENRWNKNVLQNNDIYIDIKKNEEYSKTRIIKSVTIDNFNIVSEPSKGEMAIYKPSKNSVKNFENKEEYKAYELEFLGDTKEEIQNLKIANQGGRIAFRCANENIDTYISNEEVELNYQYLLKKINVTDEDLKAIISFDVKILLTNKKVFKASVQIELPANGVSEEGRSSIELEDLDIIFKRVEN